ncbi:MAG: hypothetical protein K2X29_06305, partial [Candidatus Obscuribacterales bacterium]|nr:hypothetical protein [Candidatus Obscuribacterales bacterium]
MEERVVVTGLGPVCAVGVGKDEFWNGIVSGRSGVGKVTLVPEKEQSACKIAAEMTNFDPKVWVDPKKAKRMDRFIQMAIAASKLAAA